MSSPVTLKGPSGRCGDAVRPGYAVAQLLVVLTLIMPAFAVMDHSDGSDGPAAASGGDDGNIHWSISDNTLTLSRSASQKSGDMKDYTQMRPAWTFDPAWDSVMYVVIGNDVTSIGVSAFEECETIISVTVGEGVKSIRDHAFYDCYKIFEVINLSTLDIESDSRDNGFVAYYAKNVFTSAQDTTIKTTDDGFVYGECDVENGTATYLLGYVGDKTQIVLPQNLGEAQSYVIYKSAFAGHDDIVSVTIPDSVTSIREYQFEGCTSIVTVILGGGLKSILAGAFEDCYTMFEVINLSELDIEKGSKEHGEVALEAMNVFTDVEKATVKTTADGFVYGVSEGDAYLLAYVGAGGEIVLPDSLGNGIDTYEIYKSAFRGIDSIVAVTIPQNVTSIGNHQFQDCERLAAVSIGKDVKSIERYQFGDCESLVLVVLGAGVESIQDYAFEGCEKMFEVINLSELDIEKGSSDYGEIAQDAKNVFTSEQDTTVDITADGFVYGECESAFYLLGYVGNGTDIVLPDKLGDWQGPYRIYNYAFRDSASLVSITVPDAVTAIGNSVFVNCTSLVSLNFGSGVGHFGDDTFRNTPALTNITVSKDNTHFYSSSDGVLFDKKMTSLVLYPSGKTQTEYTVPDSVRTIEEYAFSGCSHLESVVLSKVTAIGRCAFYNCYYLGSVTIGENVESIADRAFDCMGLDIIYCNQPLDDVDTWQPSRGALVIMSNGGHVDGGVMDTPGVIPSANGFVAPGGKQFKEYNTEQDGSGTTYRPGDTYDDSDLLVLYVQWTDSPSSSGIWLITAAIGIIALVAVCAAVVITKRKSA